MTGILQPMKFLRALILLICVTAVVTGLSTSLAFAGPNQLFEEYGVSPRDAAMANSFSAIADDYSAAFYNPAGLVWGQGHHFHFGYRGIIPNTFMKFNPSNGRNLGEAPSTDVFLFGFSTDMDFREMINPRITDRLGLGLALAVGKYLKSFTLYADPNTPYMFRYAERPVSLLSLYTGFALKLYDWFSVGGSICAAPSETYTDVIAHTEIRIPSMQNETHQGMGSRAWSKIEPVIGLMFRVPLQGREDYLGFALVWRDEVFTVDGSGEITTVTRIVFEETGETYDLPMSSMELHQLTGFSPMSVTGAVSWRPTENLRFNLDGVWRQWSAWLDGDERHPQPEFSDTFHLRLGYEQQTAINWAWVHDLIVRAGYYYEPSPVPDMNGMMNIIDPDKHVGSVGLGFVFNDPLGVFNTPVAFDTSYQLHWLITKHLNNDDDPIYPELDAGGQIHNFAAALAFQF